MKSTKKPIKKDQKQQNTAEIKAKLEPLFSHLLHLQLPYPTKIVRNKLNQAVVRTILLPHAYSGSNFKTNG